MIPRRQAAIIAEEINRRELESGLIKEEEGEEEDEDYNVNEDDSGEKPKPGNFHSSSFNKNESILTQVAKNKAEQIFANLNKTSVSSATRMLSQLRREEKEEEPENSKKKRKHDESWTDPMLKVYLTEKQNPKNPNSLEIARDVLKNFGTTQVTESVKFAGEVVDVVKTVDKSKIVDPKIATKSALEEMIIGITKKRGVTTVEKSSYDWEKYKQENNLQTELQDATKVGFVEKQEFLNRVDERQFEQERTVRERERAIRDASNPSRHVND